MSFWSWNRAPLAALLLALAWFWTATRVAAFQIRTEAETAFWSGRLEEALGKYRLLEHFGPSKRKARAGLLEVYLNFMEKPRQGGKAPGVSEEKMGGQLQKVVRGRLEEEALRPDAWASLADVYGVLKPGNQALRTYSLEEVARTAQDKLEIEDLLRIRALEVSIELDLNDFFHRNALGDLAWQLGLRDYAKKQYSEVVTILPDPDRHLFLAPGEVSDEMVELVVASLNRAMQPPRNASRETVYRTLGQFFLIQRRYPEAYDAFQKSQDVRGRSTASWKALALTPQGRFDEAIALYREAMVEEGLEPENRFYVLSYLGGLLELQGRHREAAEAFRSALVLKPHNPGTLNQLGRVYEAMGLWQDAEDCYVRASEIGTQRITNLAQLVQFYRRIGKPDLALAAARKMVQMEPDEPLYREQVKELEESIENERR